ncbi:hypothetical protein PRIPAC_79818 [Pristionchus pacificus]|uniref:G protein-coupled receptor n=1 Tax=Pristionchus pacificus TaxID=54126 RepID=A0A2A6CNL1_PRIPA|nr:hypothetical protein PRIPAC_79818 [Pristionchus pacificus]|eukprot:PDM79719.1 G protein-coupled receptor [Pristionchus pacificus]
MPISIITHKVSAGAEYGLALFSHTASYWPEKASLIANLLVVVLFMEPFVLLAFHFIYRYLALWSPSLLHQHSGKFAIAFISLNCLSIGITVKSLSDIWATSKSAAFFVDILRNEYGINFLISPRPNFFSINFKKSRDPRAVWNWPVMKSMAMVTIPAALSISICFICTYLILKGFSTKTLKIRFRLLQIQLFHALLFQFAVPMMLVCLPFTLGLSLSLLGLDMGQLANICGLVFELCPAVDPFIIILAVPRFKRIVLEKIRCIRIERFRHNELREQSRVRHYFSLLMGREPMSGGDTPQAAGRVIPIAFLSSRAVCT